MGGVLGWLVNTLGKHFAKEIIEFIKVNVDYVEIKTKAEGTIDEENRNDATDTLNDIIK